MPVQVRTWFTNIMEKTIDLTNRAHDLAPWFDDAGFQKT